MNKPDPLIATVLGCLLHDIGKPIQRAKLGYRGTHSSIGRAFLKKVWLQDGRNPSEFANEPEEHNISASDKTILDAVSFHHGAALRHAAEDGHLATDSPAYISYIADNIAAGADRRKEESDDIESVSNWNPQTSLSCVYNHFSDRVGVSTYPPELLDDREPLVFPETAERPFNVGRYTEIAEKLRSSLEHLATTPEYVQSLLNVLEATLTYVPSSTDVSEATDISLYDHLKLTGAFGSCIWHYLKSSGRTDLKFELFDRTEQFYQEEAFLLASFDISGIQNFIYTIHSSGAAKMLRARSFYLEMLCEHLVDTLLNKLELSRANLIYLGGGHAYLILPNTETAHNTLHTFEVDTNAWLLEHFQTGLFMATGQEPFSASVVMRRNANITVESTAQTGLYAQLYRRISEQIGAKKLARYGAAELQKLNSAHHSGLRECQVCHRVDQSVKLQDDRQLCSLCRALSAASSLIQDAKFMLVGDGYDLPLPHGKGLGFAKKSSEALEALDAGARVYAKNKFYTGPEQGVHLWVGDYSYSPDFSDYAKDAKGIKRLAVVRLDVDNLGDAFTRGFGKQQGGKFNTISRTSSFSRQLSLFFRQHINYILEYPKFRALVPDGSGARKVTIIYSGGDDVFAVGSWNDVLEFAIELHDCFTRYTDEKLTISGGIGMYPDKYPISVMARETGDLEAAAKQYLCQGNHSIVCRPDADNDDDPESRHPRKDSLALFTADAVFGWDELRECVVGEKLTVLRSFFGDQDERGKAFIYKLLDLLRERDPNKPIGRQITLARWVYFLARLEPRDADKKVEFREFAKQLHEWFQNDSDARQLVTALELYVYLTREGGK